VVVARLTVEDADAVEQRHAATPPRPATTTRVDRRIGIR
jgi:hypothetical protein